MLQEWQRALIEKGYAVRTVNARTSAVNRFLEYAGRKELQAAPLAVEGASHPPELSRSEYLRLLGAAKLLGKERTYFLLKTICAVGMRVDELQELTAERLQGGVIIVRRRNRKTALRIPGVLKEELKAYARRRGIESGPLFLTKTGSLINRKHVHYDFKQLCWEARVPEEKATPGCLRALHERTYEAIQNSISVLTELAYEKLLEEEQAAMGWEEHDVKRMKED